MAVPTAAAVSAVRSDLAHRDGAYPPTVVWSHGRSGSTLLLDTIASDPGMWPIYEPLQEVRQRPPAHFFVPPEQVGPCRDRDDGTNTLQSPCPLRDASIVLAALSCNFVPVLSAWYAELELTRRHAAFLPHEGRFPGAGFTTTRYEPHMAAKRTARARQDQRGCRSRKGRVAKVIRLNGELQAVRNVTRSLHLASPLVVHLVRDPRAVYASRKRLSQRGGERKQDRVAFGVPDGGVGHQEERRRQQQQQQSKLRAWARSVCQATRRDAEVGTRSLRNYELVDYSEFVRRPAAVVERLYARHFRRPVPEAVRAYLRAHIQSEASAATTAGTLETANASWRYAYSTTPRSVERVDRQWEGELASWELRAIDAECTGTPTYRSKPKLLERAQQRQQGRMNGRRRVAS